MRRSIAFTASLLALSLAAGSALAQTDSVRIGQTVRGSLTAEGPTGPDDGFRYHDYRLRLRAGQRFEALLTADSFDAYLEVYAPGEVAGEPLAADDDGVGDGTTNSRLRHTARTSGVYTLRARNLGGLQEGAYTLAVRRLAPPPPAPRPRPLVLGATAEGSLAEGDPRQEGDGFYDAYGFRAQAGDRLALSMNSEAFDPVVVVGRLNGTEFEELGRNDDGPGRGLNSHLVFTAPTAGDYVVRATGLASNSTGAYTLGLEAGPPPAPTTPIAFDQPVEGELTVDDGLSDDGVRADLYRFTGRAGQRVQITMSSEVFDTYLALVQAGQTTALEEDDDGAGEGTNSRISHTLEADGDYVIQARAFGEGVGAYSLTLVDVPPPPPPASLAFGGTIQGEIDDADPKDDANKHYDAYVVSAAAGQRIQAVMRSGDFDTYLEIGRPGDAWEALASDDDGLGEGTDSRLNYTATEAGDYVVRASPLGPDTTGVYSLELIDRGPEPTPGSLLVGATARGSLSEADTIAAEGGYYDAYRVSAKADEKLTITMVSNEFDAYVEVGSVSDDGTFESLAFDDDSLGDTHARLEWAPSTDGTYEIRARSFAPATVGAYALTVERKP